MIVDNKDQLIDIYDIWYEPFWLQPWFIMGISVCLCIGIVLLLYYFYKKYMQQSIILNHSFVAYQELNQLKKSKIKNENDGKNSYFTLTLIVKKYLISRYPSFFDGLTDKEIIQQAHNIMPEDCVVILQKVLQGMMFVKFEHGIVATEKLEKDIMLIESFIQKTTLKQDIKGI